MIVFQTMLLGLVFGLQPVTLMVGPQVKSVDVLLDGTTIGVLAGEPWSTQCDFGESPHPHELVAVARDGSGREIGRARQWVNMPRAEAEATLLLERGPQPQRVVAARLAWNEVKGTAPKTVRVTLDGKALTIEDPKRFELPPCDPAQAHVLSAELVFAKGRTARADAAFGGDIGEETQSELTAVPLVLEPGTSLPALSDVQTWFRDGDASLRVFGVEQGPFDVVLIPDQAVRQVLARERGSGRGVPFGGQWRTGSQLLIFDPGGANDNRLFVAFAVPQLVYGSDAYAHVNFPTYPPMEFVTSNLRARLANLDLGLAAIGVQTLADAVATAGVLAAANNRPRAIVLLLAGSREDASSITPTSARAYLQDMHVPLVVWSLLGDGETDGWGTAEDVSSGSRMDRAAKHLRNQLIQEHIVWLEGAHLPQRIRLAEGVKGAHLAP